MVYCLLPNITSTRLQILIRGVSSISYQLCKCAGDKVAGGVVVGEALDEVIDEVGLFSLRNQVSLVYEEEENSFPRIFRFFPGFLFFMKNVSLHVLLGTHFATESLNRRRWCWFCLCGGNATLQLTVFS